MGIMGTTQNYVKFIVFLITNMIIFLNEKKRELFEFFFPIIEKKKKKKKKKAHFCQNPLATRRTAVRTAISIRNLSIEYSI